MPTHRETAQRRNLKVQTLVVAVVVVAIALGVARAWARMSGPEIERLAEALKALFFSAAICWGASRACRRLLLQPKAPSGRSDSDGARG